MKKDKNVKERLKQKQKRLGFKIVVSFSLLFIISIVSILSFAYVFSNSIFLGSTAQNLQSIAKEKSLYFSSKLKEKTTSLEVLARDENIYTMDPSRQAKSIRIQQSHLEGAQLQISEMSGRTYIPGTNVEFDLSDKSNFIQTVKENRTIFTNPIKHAVTGEMIVIITTPIYANGDSNQPMVGVLGSIYPAAEFNKIVEDVDFGEDSYAFIIDKAGNKIAHSDVNQVIEQENDFEKNDSKLRDYVRAQKTMVKSELGIASFAMNKTENMLSYAPIPKTEWFLGVVVRKASVMSALSHLQKKTFLVAMIFLVATVLVSYFIGKSIARPIRYLSGYSKKISKGELTEPLDKAYLERLDEIGDLTRAFSGIRENVSEMIRSIRNNSNQLLFASDALSSRSEEISRIAEDVSRTVDELAKGAMSQAESTESGAEQVASLGDIMTSNFTLNQNVTVSTQNVKNTVGEGLEALDTLIELSDETSHAAAEILNIVENTEKSSEKISVASEMIASIADQTNLLALNAAIEAARAGELGRGFAVVAEEIRKLAEESTQSTEHINAVVEELVRNARYGVTRMKEVADIVEKQKSSVSQTQDRYNNIAKAIGEAESSVTAVMESTQEMENKKAQIIEVLQSLAAIAEENAASTEETSASTQEQSAQLHEISSQTQTLMEIARELETQIEQFKIE